MVPYSLSACQVVRVFCAVLRALGTSPIMSLEIVFLTGYPTVKLLCNAILNGARCMEPICPVMRRKEWNCDAGPRGCECHSFGCASVCILLTWYPPIKLLCNNEDTV